MTRPEDYPRRVLVALCGLSPQVVTETIYALAVTRPRPYFPTELHLLTTTEGAQRARLTLLSRSPGYFQKLRGEYGLPPILFDEGQIHVLRGSLRDALDDLRSEEDHRAAANQVTEWIRMFTEDASCSVHVSLAGGRKALGFFAGYALSLLGREQDRLSHVLVTSHFESHPEFFYPPKQSRILYSAPPDSRPMDASEAQIDLAEIPFVRLRRQLPLELLCKPLTFDAAVAAANSAVDIPELRLNLRAESVIASGVAVKMPPADFTFLMWLARRRRRGAECPSEGAPDLESAREYLSARQSAFPDRGPDRLRTQKTLARGMEKGFFLERKSRVNRAFERALGPRASAFQIVCEGSRPHTSYRLGSEIQVVFEEGES